MLSFREFFNFPKVHDRHRSKRPPKYDKYTKPRRRPRGVTSGFKVGYNRVMSRRRV